MAIDTTRMRDDLDEYLAALGYTLGLVVADAETGEIVASAGIPTPTP